MAVCTKIKCKEGFVLPDKDPEANKKNRSDTPNKLLTRKEFRDAKEKQKQLSDFLSLFDNFVDDMNRSKSFEDTYDIITSFVVTSRRLFGKCDQRINSIIEQLTDIAEKSRKEMAQISRETSKLIQETVKLYNAEFHSDIVFDGDITKWLKRTFPLMSLYVKKNKL